METATRPRDARAAPLASIREILFPTDLSSESRKAFEHARFLAEHFHAALTLYHVSEARPPVEILPHHYPPAADTEEERSRREEQAAREEMARWATGLDVRHELLVERKDSVTRALVGRIRAAQPDLTVMATHGRKGFAHFLLGSVTERVINHAHRPVLCVREPAHGAAFPYRRILLPTDLSLASRRAFPLAALLAQAFEAEVIALHVYAPPSVMAVGATPRALTAPVPSESSLWRFTQPDFSGLDVTALVTVGTPWDRIGETARTERADLIVMSTRGLDSLSDRILGSNSERVVRHAPCPVLVA